MPAASSQLPLTGASPTCLAMSVSGTEADGQPPIGLHGQPAGAAGAKPVRQHQIDHAAAVVFRLIVGQQNNHRSHL